MLPAEFTAGAVAVDGFSCDYAAFHVFAVLETEADLHRRRSFSGLARVPQGVLRDALKVPVFMTVCGHIHQFGRAWFFFEAAVREVDPLKRFHRFRGAA